MKAEEELQCFTHDPVFICHPSDIGFLLKEVPARANKGDATVLCREG